MCLAVPGRIIRIRDAGTPFATAEVDFSGVVREASLGMLPEAREGQYIIVHAGCALNILDEDEALKTLEELRVLGEMMGMGG